MKFFVTGVGGQLGHDVMNELSLRGMKEQEATSHLPTAELLTVHQLLPCHMYSLISLIKKLLQK